MPSGTLLLAYVVAGMIYFGGTYVVKGVRAVEHGAQRAGHALVAGVKKVGHKLNPCDGSDCLFNE